MWQNGYTDYETPNQSPFSYFKFITEAESVTVTGTTSIYADPSRAHLGLVINDVVQSPIQFTRNGTESFTVTLGAGEKIVEIVAGAQTLSTTVIGSYLDSIDFNGELFSPVSPSTAGRILIYGDSIASGTSASNPETAGYTQLLKYTHGWDVMVEAWGSRKFHDDASTAGLQTTFVNRVVSYNPALIYFAIGLNDFSQDAWSPVDFGTAYAAVLDGINTALPGIKILCQTPTVMSAETGGLGGATLEDYRDQITTACNARAWCVLVDGTAILELADLADGVHPSTAGHAKYAAAVDAILTSEMP